MAPASPYVRLLGEPRIQFEGRTIPVLPDQRHQLLALLAYCGEAVARERVASLFWPDRAPRTARHNLRQLLKRTRRLEWLAGLEADAHHLSWPVETDVAAYLRAVDVEAWDEAFALYREDLLASAIFDEVGDLPSWWRIERETLKERHRETVLRRVEELDTSGRGDEAARHLAVLLARDPLDETSLQRLMALLQRLGRHERASRAYRAFRMRLAEELDLEPTSTTEALAHEISRAGAAPAPAARSGARVASSAGPGSAARRGDDHDLPLADVSFVGRTAELERLTHYLLETKDRRLVTISGAGGVGKTRLALHVAHGLRDDFPGGVHFVPLASVDSPKNVPNALAGALGIRATGTEETFDLLLRHVADGRRLIVLDNYEHLLADLGVVTRLLEECPRLTLLITSRERLNLEQEQLFPLDGFAYPEEESSPEAALAFDAVRFFQERAERVRPAFRVTEETLPGVLAICRAVDGLPLGLELAAVWVRTMPPVAIARALVANLDFLSNGSRNVHDRHRSIRAAFDHSWSLLTGEEQAVLRKLSVFEGAIGVAAAASVADASLAVLAALVDKSLLHADPVGRYHRHPLLHHYMRDEAAAHPAESREARKRHAAHFAALAQEVSTRKVRRSAWIEALAREHDNLRGALDHLEAEGEVESALRTAAALAPFWYLRGHLDEGRARMTSLLNMPAAGSDATRVAALCGAGLMANEQGDYDAAHASCERALALARRCGDESGAARALGHLGVIADRRDDYAAAEASSAAALAIWRRLGNRREIARELHNLAMVTGWRGEYDASYALFEEGLAIKRELEDTYGIARSLFGWGVIAHRRGELGRARSLYDHALDLARRVEAKPDIGFLTWRLAVLDRDEGEGGGVRAPLEESLEIMRGLGDDYGVSHVLCSLALEAEDRGELPRARALHAESLRIRARLGTRWYLAESFECIARLTSDDGGPERAAALWGAAESLHELVGAPLPEGRRERYREAVDAARGRVDEACFDAAWARGRSMGEEEAVARALEAVHSR